MEKDDKKYLIGDISRMSGIPLQTLRYYEKRGILKPHRSEINGYRYYRAWDTNDVFDLMILKNNGFSIDQIESLLNSADANDIETILDQTAKNIQDQIQKLNYSLKTISVLHDNLEKISRLNQYNEQTSPSISLYLYRKKNTVENKQGCQNLKLLYEERKDWIKNIESLTPTFIVNDLNDLSWYWGFSDIHKNTESVINTEPDFIITSMKSLHTVFEANDEGTFEESLHEVIKSVENRNYKIIADPYGTLLIKTHEKEVYHRYFEIWIPVVER